MSSNAAAHPLAPIKKGKKGPSSTSAALLASAAADIMASVDRAIATAPAAHKPASAASSKPRPKKQSPATEPIVKLAPAIAVGDSAKPAAGKPAKKPSAKAAAAVSKAPPKVAKKPPTDARKMSHHRLMIIGRAAGIPMFKKSSRDWIHRFLENKVSELVQSAALLCSYGKRKKITGDNVRDAYKHVFGASFYSATAGSPLPRDIAAIDKRIHKTHHRVPKPKPEIQFFSMPARQRA